MIIAGNATHPTTSSFFAMISVMLEAPCCDNRRVTSCASWRLADPPANPSPTCHPDRTASQNGQIVNESITNK